MFAARDGVRIAIRLTPRASTDRLRGVSVTADGQRVLNAAVTAPPEDGRANAALLRLLAWSWRVPQRDLSLLAGAASRRKTVHLAGDPQRLYERLGALIATAPED